MKKLTQKQIKFIQGLRANLECYVKETGEKSTKTLISKSKCVEVLK